MENYTAQEQIKIMSQVDVLVGAHGNGLSHTFWQKPNRYVIEMFWHYAFYYDYATAAEMMNHTYLALQNGKLLDSSLIRQRDHRLKEMRWRLNPDLLANKTAMMDFAHIIHDFIDTAMEDLGIS